MQQTGGGTFCSDHEQLSNFLEHPFARLECNLGRGSTITADTSTFVWGAGGALLRHSGDLTCSRLAGSTLHGISSQPTPEKCRVFQNLSSGIMIRTCSLFRPVFSPNVKKNLNPLYNVQVLLLVLMSLCSFAHFHLLSDPSRLYLLY